MSRISLACHFTNCSRCYIHSDCCFTSTLSPVVHQVSRGIMLPARWWNINKRRCGDVFPACFKLLWPNGRHGENLALGVHASAASSRGRVGLASLRWWSRRPRRSLENAQLRSRFPEQWVVVVCLTREFIEDSDCMNYLATALDSSKPLSKYIFVLFDDIQPTSVPRRLRQLLLPDSDHVGRRGRRRRECAWHILAAHAQCLTARSRSGEMSTTIRHNSVACFNSRQHVTRIYDWLFSR